MWGGDRFGADKAVIPPAKLAGYALSAKHDKGGSGKARVFASVLGHTAENADALAQAITQALPHQAAEFTAVTEHGVKYQADLPITGPAGSALVRTGWIVHHGESIPRLTSARVLKKKAQP